MTNALDYIQFEEDFYPFWEYLGLDETCTPKEVSDTWGGLSLTEKQSPSAIFAFKCLSDPYFSVYYKNVRSIQALYDAGFFIDQYEDNVPYELQLHTTALHKVEANLDPSSPNNIVLVSTGGFSPIHDGHIKMMEIARQHMENLGYNVAGGFLSPSHDNYVSQKHSGSAAMNAEKRIFLAEKSLLDNAWLSVDRWEALYNKYSVNFTDVILRLQMYLSRYLGGANTPKVCFVYGSDNVDFGHAFSQDSDLAVCVQRTNTIPCLPEYKGVHFVKSEDTFGYSSTAARCGNMDQIPLAIRDEYGNAEESLETKKTYIIRNDLRHATSRLGLVLSSELERSVLEKTKSLIEKYVPNVHVSFVDVDEQLDMAKRAMACRKVPSLSLDVYFDGDARLEISRQFLLSDSQVYSRNLVNRPNTPNISEQVARIQPGQYCLIEDDSVSGTTLQFVQDVLPQANIDSVILLSEYSDTPNKDVYDVMDMRDIIFGLPDGGLVIKYKDIFCRAPYALPYVSPHTRSKIPLGCQMEFSKDMWALNSHFYSSLNEDVCLADMDMAFSGLMREMGFSPDQKMKDIVSEHSEGLRKVGYSNV